MPIPPRSTYGAFFFIGKEMQGMNASFITDIKES